MASATVAAVSHSLPIPPSSLLSPIPRIRPPRILPGTPSPNSKPKPQNEKPPPGHVWVQGKWRNPSSNAAKEHQYRMGRRIKRALKHHVHGMNIYAYKHIHTSQVVYSLSRIMESSQIMPQLVFHCKKTVPAALRRDLWRPYFSIHYPDNAVGAKAGLFAYSKLRKLSLQRQLKPPKAYLVATRQDLEKAKRAAGDPLDVYQKLSENKLKLPMVGQLLPQKLRARKLMDQKATSVADVAHVLEHSLKSLNKIQEKVSIPASEAMAQKLKEVGYRRRKTLSRIYQRENDKANELQAREDLLPTLNRDYGEMPLDRHVQRQLNYEYGGTVDSQSFGLRDIEALKQGSVRAANQIQVLWADLRDGTYARSWPQGVFHGQLHPVAYAKKNVPVVIQREKVDEDGTTISEQKQQQQVYISSNPHIIGRENTEDEYQSHRAAIIGFAEGVDEARVRSEKERARRQLPGLRRTHVRDIEAYEDFLANSKLIELTELDAERRAQLSEDQLKELKQVEEQKSKLQQNLAPLLELEMQHPEVARELDLIEHWEKENGPLQSASLKDEDHPVWQFLLEGPEIPAKMYREGNDLEAAWRDLGVQQTALVRAEKAAKGEKVEKSENKRGWLNRITLGWLGR